MRQRLPNLVRKLSSHVFVNHLLRYRTAHSMFGADVTQEKCKTRVHGSNHKETNGGRHTLAAGSEDQTTYRRRDGAVGEVGVGQHEEGITRVRRRLVHASILVLRH